jgi:hypothetical protein
MLFNCSCWFVSLCARSFIMARCDNAITGRDCHADSPYSLCEARTHWVRTYSLGDRPYSLGEDVLTGR